MTVDLIPIMRTYVKSFADKASRLIERNPGYEPPLGKSHIWANLLTVLQCADDILEDYPE